LALSPAPLILDRDEEDIDSNVLLALSPAPLLLERDEEDIEEDIDSNDLALSPAPLLLERDEEEIDSPGTKRTGLVSLLSGGL
jgi:hypothetical protein